MNRVIVDGGIDAAAAIRRSGRPSFSMAALRCSDGGIRSLAIVKPSFRCDTLPNGNDQNNKSTDHRGR
jgi:hypothetical protein